MLQVLAAGLIALGTKWLLEGGIRRRDRHVIREELELADLVGDGPQSEALRLSAFRRLERYLRPPLWRRFAPVAGRALVGSGVAILLVGAGAVVVATSRSFGGGLQGYAAATSVGVAVAFTLEALQQALRRAVRPQDPTRLISDERLAEAGLTREQFKAIIAERRARWAEERKQG